MTFYMLDEEPKPNFGLFSTLLHSKWPKLHRVLAVLSAIGLNLGLLTLMFKMTLILG